jgi:hypothetical protein
MVLALQQQQQRVLRLHGLRECMAWTSYKLLVFSKLS